MARVLLALLLGATLAIASLSAGPMPSAHAAPLNDCVATDNGDPVITSFEMTPSAIDVTHAGKLVHFRLKVEDRGGPGPASGTELVWIGLGESPGFDEDVFGQPFVPTAKLVQAAPGTWVGSLEMPKGSRPGRTPLGVTLVDKAENFRDMDADNLAAAGFPAHLDVRSKADHTAPRLTSLRISPAAVDTRRSPSTVTITATARDRRAGVRGIFVNGLGRVPLSRVPGTRATFTGTRHVSTWAPPGARRVQQVAVFDRVGNANFYDFDALGRAGFDRQLTVRSRRDTRPPAIRQLRLQPAAVDVRSTDQAVTVHLHAVDRQAGLRRIDVVLWSQGTGTFQRMRLVSGTARKGEWEAPFPMPRCHAWGRSARISAYLTDDSGRTRHYTTKQLAQNGWPTRVAITAADHTPPLAGAAFDRDHPATPITVWFSEDVNGITPTSAPVRRSSEDPLADPGPAVAGTWTCRAASATPTDCLTGRVRSAQFRPTRPLSSAVEYVVLLNPEFSLDITDLAGNPFRREEVYADVQGP